MGSSGLILIRSSRSSSWLNSGTQKAPEPAADTVQEPDVTHRYTVIQAQMSYEEAAVYCESRGGHLATILNQAQFDAVADCIDTVKAKVELVTRAQAAGIYAISAMGAGNKLDPTRFQVADIAKTSVCPLCRVMRIQLKKRGIAHHRVVFSTEEPLKIVADESNGRHAPGSVSFVPPVVGLIMAGEIIKNIVKGEA